MTQKFALVLSVLFIALLPLNQAVAQSCSENTNVNGIAGTGFSNGTIGQSFTACANGKLASVSVQSGSSGTGFNNVIVQIFSGDGYGGTVLATTGQVHVRANRTTTWDLSSYNIQVVDGQKYTARFLTQSGTPMMAYGTGTNAAIDYYPRGRIHGAAQAHNDMFFSAVIESLADPVKTPADDAVDVTRDTEVKLSFSRSMEAVSGNITINNVTDASSQSIDVTTLTIDGTDVFMPLSVPLEGGKDFEIIIPSNALRSTNQIPFPGIAAGEWTFSTSTKPYGVLSTTSANLTNDAVFPFTIDFSDVVTGFALSDFVITNGVASNLGGSGDSYTFDVTPTADGEVVVSLPPDMVEAGASNGNDSTGYSLVYDGTAPDVELRTAAAGTIQTSIFDIEVVFDEPITGFESSDLQLVNAEVLSNTNTNDSLFTISLRALAEGQITVDLGAGIANDLAGNANTAAPANIDVTFSVDLESNLLSFYPFEGNANDTVATGFNGTVSGAVLTTGFDGSANSAYAFDGTDDITFGDTPIGSGSFTVAFWVKIPEGLAQNQLRTLIAKRATCGEGRFFEINYNNSSTNGHQITVEQRNNAGVANPVANLTSVGEWMHVAYVKDNDQMQSSFFINGVQQTPVAWTSTYNFENNASLKAGISACNGSGRFRYTGDMDDIHVYGRALTQVEVDLLVPFSVRNVSAQSGDNIQQGQSIEVTLNKNVVGSSVNTTNITATGATSGALTIDVSSSGNSVTITPPNGWPLDEDVTISLSGLLAENGTTLPTTDLMYSVIADEAVGLILHYPINGNVDEAIGNIANQDGTTSGTLFVEGVNGDQFGALSFDGIDDLVTLGDAPISSESFSISLWVKVPTDGSTTNNTIILSKRQACTEGKMFDMSYMRSGDMVRFSASARNNAAAGGVATGFDFPVDEWINLTYVKDNVTKKYRLIVNGVLEAEANWALTTVDVENTAPIRLGNTPCNGVDGTQRFDGLMDDLRIYDRVVEPRILSIEPERGTVNAAIDTVITLSFDRSVDASSLKATTISITDLNDTSYPYTTTFSNGDSVLTVTPDNDLPKGKLFSVSVDTLSAQIGSDFMPFETSFTTIATQLLSFSPANGQSNVDSLETISFKFDNVIDMSTLEQGIKVLGSHNGPVEGSFSMPATDSVVFTPSSYYFANEMITVYVTPSLKDQGGESIGNNKAFKFHVKSGDFAGATLSYEMTQLNATTSLPRILVPGDVDGDGDLDLVGGEDDPGTLVWFENLGSANYGAAQTIDSNNGYFDVKVTDFDFDGDLDIVAVDRAISQGVYWYENDGSANFTEHTIVSLPSSDSRSISIEDFNGDGNLDVAVASFGSNRLAVYDRDGNSLYAAANVGGPIFLNASDINDDGDLDLFIANYTNGNIAQFSNGGTATFGGVALHSATHPRSVVPIDIDEDGDIDIVYSAQSANQIGVLQNNGAGAFTNVQVGSVTGPHRIDVGDADGDGDFDILYTTAGNTADINFHYLENSGTLTLWTSKKLISTATFSSNFTQTARFADLDNDGDLDVAATDAIGGFYVFENMIIDLNEPPIVSNSIADQTIQEDDPNGLTIDVSNVFVDNDGDSFTLSASSDNAAVTATINGNNLELDLVTQDFFGDVNITVTADDGNGTNSDVFVLSVTSVNDAPEFDLSTSTITVSEDFTTTESITVTQNQPAGEDAPTYSIAPTSVTFANVSIDATTGEVTITSVANGFGTQEFTITADDGATENNTAAQTFTLTVNGVNDTPTVANAIADVSYDEDESSISSVSLATAFSDVEDADLTFSLSILSGSTLANVTLNNDMIDIVAVENAFGTVQVEVTATDTDAASVSDVFDIVINAVNDSPTFTTSGDVTVVKDFTGTETVTITADAIPFGEDSQIVTYSMSPSTVSFANVSIDSSTGEISITAVASQFGSQEFTVTADDGQAANNTATQVFTLAVLDNLPPEVINTVANTIMDEDQETLNIVDVTTLFSDPENDALTYAVSDDFGGSVNAALSGNTLQVTPVANYNGSGTITVTASDANQSASTSFTLTVNSINDDPTVEVTLSDQQATEDQNFSFTLPAGLFADVDGDAITITTGSTPDWVSFDGSVFSGTPENGDVGTASIEVIGSDGNGGSASTTFELTVENVNDAPTVTAAISDVQVEEDAPATSMNLSNVFEDVDAGDQLTFSATALENTILSLTLNGETLEVSYTADQSGSTTITVTATDGSGASVSDDFMVTVTSVNDAPAFDLSEMAITVEQNFTETLSIDIQAGAVPADEVDQTVTYSISSDDTDIVSAVLNGTTIELSALTDAFGEQTFTITADDGQAENNIFTTTLTVSVSRILSAEIEEGLKMYPNPVINTLMFNNANELDVKVISLDGRLMMHKKVNGSLNVESLDKGTYFIQADDGEKVTTHRIIKAN